jgi:hypothetical protein
MFGGLRRISASLDRLKIEDAKPISFSTRQFGERVTGVGRKMAALESEVVHRATRFKDEANALVPELSLSRVFVAIGCYLDVRQVGGEGVGPNLVRHGLALLLVCEVFRGCLDETQLAYYESVASR